MSRKNKIGILIVIVLMYIGALIVSVYTKNPNSLVFPVFLTVQALIVFDKNKK